MTAVTSSSPGGPAIDHPVIFVRPTRGWRRLDVRDLWEYRELLYFLIWRDLKVRYKQTAIGVVWVIVQPVAFVTAVTLLFGRLAGLPSDGRPYVLFAMVGVLVWQFFSRAVTESTNSLVVDQRLITRVYFPRILVPAAAVMAAFADFLITLALGVMVTAAYGILPGMTLLVLPLFCVLLLLTAFGVSFWLSALNLEYRDVSYAVPFLIQFWMFCTPVVYPSSVVPPAWRPVYALNPVSGAIDGFRWCMIGSPFPGAATLAITVFVAVLLFVSGIVWFRARERTFVDAVGSGGR